MNAGLENAPWQSPSAALQVVLWQCPCGCDPENTLSREFAYREFAYREFAFREFAYREELRVGNLGRLPRLPERGAGPGEPGCSRPTDREIIILKIINYFP